MKKKSKKTPKKKGKKISAREEKLRRTAIGTAAGGVVGSIAGPAGAAVGAGAGGYIGAKSAKLKPEAAKNPRKTSPSQRLIKRCQKLWDAYCEKPTKKNLRVVLEHLEKMKESAAKSVKDERRRCMRAANAEAKRLKL